MSCVIFTASAWADVKLPKPPAAGGTGIFELLEKRASGQRDSFPKGEVSPEELGTILWAATGLNRGGKGWTIPTAGGLPPYVKIYVVRRDGVFAYNYKDHSLVEIGKKNVMNDITNDNFVKESAGVLVFASDTDGLGRMSRFNEGNALAYNITGAMTQNAYLAANALGIDVRYMVSMNADAIKRELKLKEADSPICILPFGKR
jgi:SagB-type dehydrogenase family enzyme